MFLLMNKTVIKTGGPGEVTRRSKTLPFSHEFQKCNASHFQNLKIKDEVPSLGALLAQINVAFGHKKGQEVMTVLLVF